MTNEFESSLGSWGSYPSIFALEHKAAQPLLKYDPVIMEEKIDGSQFSFGMFGGELRMASKRVPILAEAPPALFRRAAETVQDLFHRNLLVDGFTYRAEAVTSPHHNVLTYDRIPTGGLIVFDVGTGYQEWLDPHSKRVECERLGLECVPTFEIGVISRAKLEAFLEQTSCLGGPKIEGVVVKPADYALYGVDKKVLMGKFVSPAFKEQHRTEWKGSNPDRKDFLTRLVESIRTEATWNKAIQHLRDADQLTGSPKDIGPLMKELAADLDREAADYVREQLFNHFWKGIRTGAMRGFPEYYKAKLVENIQFNEDGDDLCNL